MQVGEPTWGKESRTYSKLKFSGEEDRFRTIASALTDSLLSNNP